MEMKEGEIIREIKKGSLFVYGTDTVYGLGCNAYKSGSVLRIRKLKKSKKPFSVIAPSKKWIFENLKVRHRSFLKKLPGKYTLIFEKRERRFLNSCSGTGKLGVRIPDHEFTKIIRKAGVPFVTTSANISGRKPIRRISEIPKPLERGIDFAVDSGVLDRPPSRIFDLSGKKAKRIR
jgi:L-threonylcarbamoyladenylate synthase